MKIHEYQSKELLRKFDLPVPEGKAAFSVSEAIEAAKQLPGPVRLVKAQIHAGGRGKAGGVKLSKSLDEVEGLAKELLGKVLVTHQTGPEGKQVRRLLIEQGADIDKEFYLALTLDRERSRIAIMASPAGGMDIEEVAAKSPEKIFKEWIDPSIELRSFQSIRLAKCLGLGSKARKQFGPILTKLLKLYQSLDCSLLEINPLVLTKQGDLIALDAKINFDDNGLYRHPEILELNDPHEEDASESAAKKFDLSYISLDGNIGCMVNGAGLAMATMDIIKLEGGSPANFLDVGGGATEDKVREAFKIILRDEKVKAILVNIFGGIMKCDVIASGIVSAAKELKLSVPLIVRLEGTNVERGRAILDESGLSLITANGMKEAAKKSVQAASGATS